MESVNVKKDDKTMDKEHHHPINEKDPQDIHGDVNSKNDSAALGSEACMASITPINCQPTQLELMGSSSDVQYQEGVEKSKSKRRHSFQSTDSLTPLKKVDQSH